ncbi:MAG: A24 family peptidase [Alphaproteobacteria bacterium]|nr:A24 family peptidase [Alphaproteobacteria bacterium]
MVAISCGLGWTMLSIAVSDVKSLVVPDVLCLPAIAAGLIASGQFINPHVALIVDPDHLIGAAAGFAAFWGLREAYYHLRGREGMGLGDAKLAAAGGAWIGWQDLPLVVLVASAGLLAVVAAMLIIPSRQPVAYDLRLPFGAALAPAIWVIWLINQLSVG